MYVVALRSTCRANYYEIHTLLTRKRPARTVGIPGVSIVLYRDNPCTAATVYKWLIPYLQVLPWISIDLKRNHELQKPEVR